MDIYNEHFGSWTRQKLKEKHMTQRELAKKLKITDTYLSDILKGNRFGKEIRENIILFFNEECIYDEKYCKCRI